MRVHRRGKHRATEAFIHGAAGLVAAVQRERRIDDVGGGVGSAEQGDGTAEVRVVTSELQRHESPLGPEGARTLQLVMLTAETCMTDSYSQPMRIAPPVCALLPLWTTHKHGAMLCARCDDRTQTASR